LSAASTTAEISPDHCCVSIFGAWELLMPAPDGETDIPILTVDAVELELQVRVKKAGGN